MIKSRVFLSIIIFATLLSVLGVSCAVPSGPTTVTETLISTSIPTFTSTFTPSPTVTLTPTQTLTATPLPTGVVLETLADGSTLATDYDELYKIVLPAGWSVGTLDPREGTINDMIGSLPTLNPDLSGEELDDIVQSLQLMDLVRAIALNKDPLFAPTFSPSIEVSATDDAELIASFVTGEYEQQTRNSGSKIIEGMQQAKLNSHGVEYGTIEFERPTLSNQTTTIMARYRIAFFLIHDKLIMVKLVAAATYMEDLIPTWLAAVESVELLQP